MLEFLSKIFSQKQTQSKEVFNRPIGTPIERISQIPRSDVYWAEFMLLQGYLTEQEKQKIEQQLYSAFESLSKQLEQTEWGSFANANDIIILVSGKSSFIALELLRAFKAFLPEGHPLRMRAHVMQLGDIENAALYGKYREHPNPYYDKKHQEQEILREAGLQFIEDKARAKGVLKGSGKPTLVMFEEFSGSEGKIHNSLKSLRDAGYDAYALSICGLPTDATQNEKKSIEFIEGARELSKCILVGNRTYALFDFLSLTAVLRSGFAGRLHAERAKSTGVITAKERHAIRMARQAFRDLIRELATDVLDQRLSVVVEEPVKAD